MKPSYSNDGICNVKDYTVQHIINEKAKRDLFFEQHDNAIKLGRKFGFYDAVLIHADLREAFETALNKINTLH